jgi:hypothetical protein
MAARGIGHKQKGRTTPADGPVYCPVFRNPELGPPRGLSEGFITLAPTILKTSSTC